MTKLVKILHIDKRWKVIYILMYGGAKIKTEVSIITAVALLYKQTFDLILSEPHHIAILGFKAPAEEGFPDRHPFRTSGPETPWDLTGSLASDQSSGPIN